MKNSCASLSSVNIGSSHVKNCITLEQTVSCVEKTLPLNTFVKKRNKFIFCNSNVLFCMSTAEFPLQRPL